MVLVDVVVVSTVIAAFGVVRGLFSFEEAENSSWGFLTKF